ncbi:uncharacterized protein L969DRAFT_86843 [Mixia osmundae IAM 14324]|uniref:Cyclopropane-fatty-acyl-phospholipid synthase n=1 Tax=Mixia osmundae (strain CBS 9802 / IAM 14324 / JCM 22182 / KY 12970) TaxID=764103 RepID=G7E8W2_MIXOS|nr:uncharacterized protein L969DRAFT_86843 [Mixia osmundae IAM 14324]KEI40215.1 hypothetical protein L969DRAFT_86843 [Mixia osmundae IAM 14324]GAA99580.1 hypothetical protein E5Q_06281 [Mixia osmundae IAM 14324]
MSEGYVRTRNYKSEKHGKVASLADRLFYTTKESVVNRGWGPLVLLARTTIVALMEKITYGQLRVLTPDGIFTFGNPIIADPSYSSSTHALPGGTKKELKAELRVVNDAFWVRMLILSDLGFAEAYMVGDVEVDDLDALFKMFILNRQNLSEMSMTTSKIFSSLNYLMNSRFVNSVSNSISNISAHYDLAPALFQSFLSPDMTYSCAIFSEAEGGLEGDLAQFPRLSAAVGDVVKQVAAQQQAGDQVDTPELEAAQRRKLQTIIEKARIGKGDRVLEIGSGWGSFAMQAVQTTGCTVDTLTLSVEQQEIAEARIAEAGLTASIRVHLMDYRNIPDEFVHAFDRVVSIEMLEAVGIDFLDSYFAIVDKALKPDRGLGVFQVITVPEGRFEAYRKSVDFIQKWVFPGGICPSLTSLFTAINKGSQGRLLVETVENIGPHYARTLREWRRRFEARFESHIVPSLRETYPELKSRKQLEVFRRKWSYYFCYCETGFSMRSLGDHIITITREGNLSLY